MPLARALARWIAQALGARLDEICQTVNRLERTMSESLDDLKNTADQTAAEVHQIVGIVSDQSAKISDLTAKLDAALAQPALDAETLGAINDELKAANAEIAGALPVAPAPATGDAVPAQ